MNTKEKIEFGNVYIGIEIGSTRIKSILIDDSFNVIGSGIYDWENELVDKIWTYSFQNITNGIQDSFKNLIEDVKKKYGIVLKKTKSIGISAMMHGYLVFDKNDKQLVPFRTWRNTMTGESADILSNEFNFNIPQRWSIAHLYQAILNKEKHVKEIAFITTLAGYIHYLLTNQKILGVGEASGVFPIDSSINNWDKKMIEKFEKLITNQNLPWKLTSILPKVLVAGENGGTLTKEGAKFLDPSGNLEFGIPLCPPEGDAGTGMVATNSIAPETGNVSAGTSIFAMIVLDKPLSKFYTEVDMVTTPTGKPVAMVHCNNCTTDIQEWLKLFNEFAQEIGVNLTKDQLYNILFNKALEGNYKESKILSYNYFSGEPITELTKGRPLLVRQPNSILSLANFMKIHLYSTLATMRIGLNILNNEKVKIKCIYGHGGFFKTKEVGQRMLATCMNVPVSVMETASEGGPWGMAILGAYMINGKGASLEKYLENNVFQKVKSFTIEPNPKDVEDFRKFMCDYVRGIVIEKAAVACF